MWVARRGFVAPCTLEPFPYELPKSGLFRLRRCLSDLWWSEEMAAFLMANGHIYDHVLNFPTG